MANTYTTIHIQIVFAVKYRVALINNVWKEELFKYVAGIITNHNHKTISFTDEYKKFLKLFKVDFEERFILKEPE